MKGFLFVWFCLFLMPFNSIAQQKSQSNDRFNEELERINIAEASYQITMFSIDNGPFSGAMNFRLEDELTNDGTYVLLQDVTFLDLQFNYTFRALQIGLFLENLLGFNDTGYAIAPVLDNENGINMVYFSHEPNFLMGASITYNF